MSEVAEMPDPLPPERRSGLHVTHSLVAMVVAVAAIGLAAWEGVENRRHHRLSVQPRLSARVQIGTADGGAARAQMGVESTGLGPAVIRRFQIYFDGAPIDAADAFSNDPWGPVTRVGAAEGARVNTTAIGVGSFFPIGATTNLIELEHASGDRVALSTFLTRIAVDICYCSVYGSDCEQVATRDIAVPRC
jgi:hypothetical protein